jgi:flagellar export protein FliJ
LAGNFNPSARGDKLTMSFKFRLQKVLEYREHQEEEAKQLFLERRSASLQAQSRFESIGTQRRGLLNGPIAKVADHLELEARLSKVDDEERFAYSALNVLRNEEEAAELVWRERRRDLESMRKLREKGLADWNLMETRREQSALDEWSILRRNQGREVHGA